MKQAGVKEISLDDDFLLGKAIAEDIMDSDNNDELKILIAANTEITQEIIDLIKEKNVSKFKVINC